MNYPTKVCYDPFIGEVTREMTPDEYEETIEWYKKYIKDNEDDTARRVQDYVNYLKRWFSDDSCDGLHDFKTRYTLHKLPMSANIYMFH